MKYNAVIVQLTLSAQQLLPVKLVDKLERKVSIPYVFKTGEE
jgi:hypothetical protein